jgi:hypothetical protein
MAREATSQLAIASQASRNGAQLTRSRSHAPVAGRWREDWRYFVRVPFSMRYARSVLLRVHGRDEGGSRGSRLRYDQIHRSFDSMSIGRERQIVQRLLQALHSHLSGATCGTVFVPHQPISGLRYDALSPPADLAQLLALSLTESTPSVWETRQLRRQSLPLGATDASVDSDFLGKGKGCPSPYVR